MIVWEQLVSRNKNNTLFTSVPPTIFRAKVPGGWLIATASEYSVTFLPDPNHEWDGNSLP